MPIYEYFSPDTNRIYSFYARSLAQRDAIPRCPDKPDAAMRRMVSSFAITRNRPESESLNHEDDPAMDAAMAEMEREMGALDLDDPDPRHMAHMLRKMSNLTGEKIDGQLEEVVRRMEGGESLESLEERFADMDDAGEDDFDGMTGLESDDATTESAAKRLRVAHLLRRLRRGPERDPNLYELADYL